MSSALEILNKYWGYPSFRPMQEDIVNSAAEGNDVLALLPTGGGKSVCFQVPGLLRGGLTIVVSPLIALMKDQVEQLQRRNIKATAIYSGLSKREIDIVLDNCIYGDIKFLYVSPERLKTELFRERAKKMEVSLIAVDEAHCVSLWGFDFRPPYLEIPEFRALLPGVPMMALTATATEKVKQDIIERLELNDPKTYSKSFARENISYSVRKVLDKNRKLLEILRKVPGTGIVYVNSRKETREIASFLNQKNIKADFYHAGLDASTRAYRQEEWIKGRTRIMVATNAFGMGIDKPDVRSVVHMEVPSSPEAYFQEAGRGGRDGETAYSVILYHDRDITELKERAEQSNPDIKYLKRIYQALANFLKVAAGSGDQTPYEFDISQFCQNFDLDARQAYYAIKKLENEGLLYLNEGFKDPSRVWILIDRKDLYKFQVENSRFDPVIQAILRLYGGETLGQFVRISESEIARQTGLGEKEVEALLGQLSNNGILDYRKRLDKPQLIFLSQRYDVAELPLDSRSIMARRDNEFEKVKAMTGYVENAQRCRSQILLDYFGEVSFQECGMCDICLMQKEHEEEVHHEQYLEQIMHILKEGPRFIEELIEEIEPDNEEDIQLLVRDLIDQGKLYYDEHWKVCVK